MATVEIRKPFEVFNDTDGRPLDSGYVYIGEPGSEPQSTPKAVYWDAALTVAAVQPLRTNNGFVVNNGTPSAFYTDGVYSIKVVDYSGVTLALRLVNSDGVLALGTMASQNEGTGGGDFRDNAANDTRFLLRSEYAPASAGGGSSQFKIINGDFAVNQGETMSASAKVSALYPPILSGSAQPPDRFFPVAAIGTTGSWALTANTAAIGNLVPARYFTFTCGSQSAVGDFGFVVHRIESARTYAGQTVTFFNWMKRATAGNVAFSIRQNFGTGGSPSADVTTYVGQATLTTVFAPYRFVASVPSVAGKTFGTNGDDYLEIVYWISAGSTYNSNTGSLGLQNTTVDFYGMHDRPGDAPIDVINYYQPPDPQMELARCQRYYERGVGVATCGRVVATVGSAMSRGRIIFKARKRAVPSFTATTSATGGGWAVSEDGATQNVNYSADAVLDSFVASAEL